MLDLIGFLSDMLYIALISFGIYCTRRKASLLQVERAMRLYLLAAFVQFVGLGADIQDVTDDGWFPPVMSALAILFVVGSVVITGRRADRMEGIR